MTMKKSINIKSQRTWIKKSGCANTSWALYHGRRSPAEQGDPAPPVVKPTLPPPPPRPPAPPPTATASPSSPYELPPMSSGPRRARPPWAGPGRRTTRRAQGPGSCCTGSGRTSQTCPPRRLGQRGSGAGGDRWAWNMTGRTRTARGRGLNSDCLLLLLLHLFHSQHRWRSSRSPLCLVSIRHGGCPGRGLQAGRWRGSCPVPDSQSRSRWCDRKGSRSPSDLTAPAYPQWSSAAPLWWQLQQKQHMEDCGGVKSACMFWMSMSALKYFCRHKKCQVPAEKRQFFP